MFLDDRRLGDPLTRQDTHVVQRFACSFQGHLVQRTLVTVLAELSAETRSVRPFFA
jgi:hypothetical protein